MKTLLSSRTFWFAVSKAVAGVLVVALTELNMVGALALVTAVLDVILRLDTKEEIGSIL